jgi:hypothetical protein
VGHAIETVKSLSRGPELKLVAKVPLAHHGRAIASSVQHIGYRDFLQWKPMCVTRSHHIPGHATANRVATSQYPGPGWRADVGAGIEIGKYYPIRRDKIQMGRLYSFTAESTDITYTKIIGHDQYMLGGLSAPAASDTTAIIMIDSLPSSFFMLLAFLGGNLLK